MPFARGGGRFAKLDAKLGAQFFVSVLPKIDGCQVDLENSGRCSPTHSSHNSSSHNVSLVSYHPSGECFMVMEMVVPDLPPGQVNCRFGKGITHEGVGG
jgi:hypothetical protein